MRRETRDNDCQRLERTTACRLGREGVEHRHLSEVGLNVQDLVGRGLTFEWRGEVRGAIAENKGGEPRGARSTLNNRALEVNGQQVTFQ